MKHVLNFLLAAACTSPFAAHAVFYPLGYIDPLFAVTCDLANQRVSLERIPVGDLPGPGNRRQGAVENRVIKKLQATGRQPLSTASRVVDCPAGSNSTIRLRLAEYETKSWGHCGAVSYPALSAWRDDTPLLLGHIVEDGCKGGYLRSMTITATGIEWCWIEDATFQDPAPSLPPAVCRKLKQAKPDDRWQGLKAARAPVPEYGTIEIRHGSDNSICNSMLDKASNAFGQPDWQVGFPPGALVLLPREMQNRKTEGVPKLRNDGGQGTRVAAAGTRWVRGILDYENSDEEVDATVLDIDNQGVPAIFAIAASNIPSRTSTSLSRFLILRNLDGLSADLRSKLDANFAGGMKRIARLFPPQTAELLSGAVEAAKPSPPRAPRNRVPTMASEFEISTQALIENCGKGKRLAPCGYKGFEFGDEGTELWPFRSNGSTFFLAYTPVSNGNHAAVFRLQRDARLSPVCVFRQSNPAYSKNG